MTTAVAVIIWILLSIIAGLSVLLLYAVFGVKHSIMQLHNEQKTANSILREIARQGSKDPADARQVLPE